MPQWKCPFCQTENPPRIEKELSSSAWIVFVVLLLVCLPLCWIPFVTMKTEKRVCSGCGTRL